MNAHSSNPRIFLKCHILDTGTSYTAQKEDEIRGTVFQIKENTLGYSDPSQTRSRLINRLL